MGFELEILQVKKDGLKFFLPLSSFLSFKQVDGMLESWVWKMAATLKSKHKEINVMIADWLSFAHQHYPIAVQNTRNIGQDIAGFLEWLEVRAQIISHYF